MVQDLKLEFKDFDLIKPQNFIWKNIHKLFIGNETCNVTDWLQRNGHTLQSLKKLEYLKMEFEISNVTVLLSK